MLSLLPNVGLFLVLLSGLQTTLATPLPHSQQHPDYHGLPMNVLFPFKGKSCDDIAKAQSLRGSFEFSRTNSETFSLAETMGEVGQFDGIPHTWLNLVKGNTKWLMGFPRNYAFSAMVWTIDESLYRFEIGQAPLSSKAMSNPDNPKEKYFVVCICIRQRGVGLILCCRTPNLLTWTAGSWSR